MNPLRKHLLWERFSPPNCHQSAINHDSHIKLEYGFNPLSNHSLNNIVTLFSATLCHVIIGQFPPCLHCQFILSFHVACNHRLITYPLSKHSFCERCASPEWSINYNCIAIKCTYGDCILSVEQAFVLWTMRFTRVVNQLQLHRNQVHIWWLHRIGKLTLTICVNILLLMNGLMAYWIFWNLPSDEMRRYS